jgi:multiple sugar transport system ATP-binding protein
MAEVKLVNVTKVFDGDVVAVNEVNVDIKDKEFVVLVGPSGCGKSTTLRMIAGLEEITSGDCYIDDRRVNEVSPKDRDIAMVFQNYALYPHMTVAENMAFGLKLRKYPKEEIDKRVNEAAKILGLETYLARKPKALSGGQRQRVAVGRAIVRKPKVFLFDEPLSNLDAKLRVQMRTEISKLHHRLGATMIYVTHDQTEAMTMGTKIVVMKDGFIQQIDSPLKLYNHPENKFVGGFIGSPAMNFVEGKVARQDGLRFVSADGGLNAAIADRHAAGLEKFVDQKIWLGIRPEDIYDEETHDANGSYQEATSKLEVVEPMGNEIYLYFTVDGSQITARVSTRTNPEPGAEAKLYFDMNMAHYFDYDTERTLFEEGDA